MKHMKELIKQIIGLYIAVLAVLFAVSFMTGCISIKNAEIKEATFNSAGWKSQAGVSGDAVIEATTTPKTDVSLPIVP